ncbi:hypothetical protein DSCA_21020 [Desulfosarcina alkanivorans]|jgi:hypothetical protein|uniref:Uncharacterized protein n=1 Tax=Desulfosarcina alkanivorans TaxID=571177 RepID=A0A5K7YF84_9BACT|nr:hypothetical protein [Desulfosarcina alkanivorans]BBO68172.1 hypothetical protein DSCA_21020 [Desulfosarcina alkanivorans]
MKIRATLIVFGLCWALPVDSGALTVEEIMLLKQNGISEATIQMMLQSEMRAGQSPADGEKMGVRTIIRPNGKPAIVYTTDSADEEARRAAERLKEERAWEMLRHLIVDTRKTDSRRPGSDAGKRD